MAVSVVRLLVLGVVRLHGRAHGYAIRRELANWRIETWTLVQPGSIYFALKQLAKEGKLEPAGPEASSEGPARQSYALTAAGEQEFFELLEAALGSFAIDEFGAGVAFMHLLRRERVIALLRDQAERAKANGEYLETLMPHFPERAEAPHMQDLLSLWSVRLGSTAGWTQQLVGRLEAGEYVMAGEGVGAG